MDVNWTKYADIITEALPFIKRYVGQTVVIKYGGSAMVDAKSTKRFADDVAMLKQVGINPIVVHGGGPQIASMLDRLDIESKFENGLRVTSERVMEVTEMVLCGSVNNEITAHINAASGLAVGINGKDANLITVKKIDRTFSYADSGKQEKVDLGFVGKPTDVNTKILDIFIKGGIIPVIAPVALGIDGKTYNINADTVAGAIAGAMRAKRLILLTDTDGVMDKNERLIKSINIAGAQRLLKDRTVIGGMIPKIETCIESIEKGIEAAVIANGNLHHAILLEIFTEGGAGTLIRGV